MKIDQIAAQLYTVRDHIKTPHEIAATLKRVREIGYEAVQVSAMGPIDEAELLEILDGEGLVCCVTHEPADKILNEPEAIVERLGKLKCKYTAYPHPKGQTLATLDEVKEFAAKLNASGKILFEAGMTLTYHNHHIEFRKVDGQLILDVIYEQTDPTYLQAELDTYWVQYGGCDPTEWCKKLTGRLPILHLKDYKITSNNEIDFAEIGYGNLDWDSIIPAAEDAGCKWFVVEQDAGFVDPFDSLRMSFEYLRKRS